jgi:hypothetical protein
LLAALAEIFAAEPRKRKRGRSLCARFYRCHERNPLVAEWFLSAAQSLRREQCRERYGYRALLERIRWDVRVGIIKTDIFRISNDLQACYARQILMRDPSLCGLFELRRTSNADALVVDGRAWTVFTKEHEAELWPEPTPKKKAASGEQSELALSETA